MTETKILVELINEASELDAVKQAMVLGFVMGMKSNSTPPQEG